MATESLGMSRKKNGIWQLNFVYLGERVQRSSKTTDQAAALQQVKDEKKRIYEEKTNPNPKTCLTLSEAIEKVYKEQWMGQKDARCSYNRAKGLLKHLGDVPLDQITTGMVRQMTQSLQRSRSIATSNRYSASLRKIYSYLKAEIPHLTIPEIKTPKEDLKRFRVYSQDEQNQVVALFREKKLDEMADLVVFLADSGARLSEALSKPLKRSATHLQFFDTKNKKHRSVPMTSRIKEILSRRDCFEMTVDYAEKKWNIVRFLMGWSDEPECILHTWRHTCASRLVEKGVALPVVRDWLGHSSIKVTERYFHIDPKHLSAAAAVLE